MTIAREDASGYRGEASYVFTPANESELAAIVREHSSITIAGAGTGVTGGSVPDGGCVVSMEKFVTVEVTKDSARVGAGVSLDALQSAAAKVKRFYAPDPTEWSASIGGPRRTGK